MWRWRSALWNQRGGCRDTGRLPISRTLPGVQTNTLVCASQVSEVSQSIKEVKLFGPKHLFLHTDTFKPFILYAAIHAEACFSVENLLEDQHYGELY